MALISKEKIFCKIFDNIKPFDGGHSKQYNSALNWAATQIRKAEEIKAITREDFIQAAKQLITEFGGGGVFTEENYIIVALVFGNLELRLFGSEDGESE